MLWAHEVPNSDSSVAFPLRFSINGGHDYFSLGSSSEFSWCRDVTGRQQRCQSFPLSPSVTSVVEQLLKSRPPKERKNMGAMCSGSQPGSAGEFQGRDSSLSLLKSCPHPLPGTVRFPDFTQSTLQMRRRHCLPRFLDKAPLPLLGRGTAVQSSPGDRMVLRPGLGDRYSTAELCRVLSREANEEPSELMFYSTASGSSRYLKTRG